MLAASLQGTWVGFCHQFGAANAATGNNMCVPYKAGALRYSQTTVYDGNSYRFSTSLVSKTYTGVTYNLPHGSGQIDST